MKFGGVFFCFSEELSFFLTRRKYVHVGSGGASCAARSGKRTTLPRNRKIREICGFFLVIFFGVFL
jgi:hypothetical protein